MPLIVACALAASTGQVVMIAVATIGPVAMISWLLKRRRRDTWQTFARRHHLAFANSTASPRVRGQLQGRSIEVATVETGSDQDVGGVAVVTMSIGLRSAPSGMTAEGMPGLIGDLATLMEDRVEFVDHLHFHNHAIVKGHDESLIRKYWNESRQGAFLRLIEQAPCDQIAIHESLLVAELRDIVSNHDQLERLLSLLMAAAGELDGDNL